MHRILSCLLFLLIALPSIALAQPKAPAKKTPATKAAKQAPTPPATDIRVEHVMIPMRDGTRLSTYLFFPPGDGPWPVLYHQRYVKLSDVPRGDTAEIPRMGYVLALQNFRGSQLSQGIYTGYRPLGLGDHKDGYDSVQYLASQPWSTGKVGSFGGSQGAYSQNILAASQPPALLAQYMIDGGLSLFHDAYRAGGAARPQRFLARSAIHARDPAHGRAILEEQFRHPTYDAWWHVEDASRHFDKLHHPAVIVGSWFDPVTKAGIQNFIERSARFPGRQQLIIGPWTHGSSNKARTRVGDLQFPPHSAFDMHAHLKRWFDHHLKGIDTAIANDPPVRYYVMGACDEPGAPGHTWRTATSFPPRTAHLPYHLLPDGKLANVSQLPREASTTYISDPHNPNLISGASYPAARDARAFEDRPDAITFTTDPLTSPLEWTGLVKVKLFVSSSAPDADFIVRVSDVYPDGRSILLIDHIRRARFRNGFESEQLMTPGQVHELAFDVGYTSIVFNTAHRIRVTIASTGSDWYEVNPQTGEPFTIDPPARMNTARHTIHHDARYPSHLIAPMMR